MKPKANVIPYSTQPHFRQCLFNHFKGVWLASSVVAAKQKLQPVRGGEFWCRLESTEPGVKTLFDFSAGTVEKRDIRIIGLGKGECLTEVPGDILGRGDDFFVLGVPDVFDLLA